MVFNATYRKDEWSVGKGWHQEIDGQQAISIRCEVSTFGLNGCKKIYIEFHCGNLVLSLFAVVIVMSDIAVGIVMSDIWSE